MRVKIIESENRAEFEKLCDQEYAKGSNFRGGMALAVYTNPVTGNPATVYAQCFLSHE